RSSRWMPALVAALALVAGGVGARLSAQADWRLVGLDGGALTPADVAHGAHVLVVWAGWSPRCKDVVERSNAIVGTYGGRAKVSLVDFQEEAADVKSFLGGKGARAAVYLDSDGSFSKQHHVASLPGLVVYKDGAVAFAGRLGDDDRAIAD